MSNPSVHESAGRDINAATWREWTEEVEGFADSEKLIPLAALYLSPTTDAATRKALLWAMDNAGHGITAGHPIAQHLEAGNTAPDWMLREMVRAEATALVALQEAREACDRAERALISTPVYKLSLGAEIAETEAHIGRLIRDLEATATRI